jgi:hypothetical protein
VQIHQFQASYQAEQDRILLRLNTRSGEELRLWLTRRMIKSLLPHMAQAATRLTPPATPSSPGNHDGTRPDALAEFRKQEVLQQSDFRTPFDAEAALLPLGHEPLLTTAIHVTALSEASWSLTFDGHTPGTPGTRSIELTLESALLLGLVHVIDTVLQHADWGLRSSAAETPPKSASQDLSDAWASALPPKYLN